ncbi:hypothetical protein HYX16_06245 [Candidatus Woesearchaeota archaeon]|nr:hypothetical protein [Candidatus Woesearchaeota archaeon]
MFRKYGFLGILLILLVEINFFYRYVDMGTLYFPLIWFGYIFLVDALVYKLSRNSLISNRPYQFLGLIILSALFWWTFELINFAARNWEYKSLGTIFPYGIAVIIKTLSFSTVLPAFFETVELIKSVHLFDNKKLKKKHNITKRFIHVMFGIGIISFILPVVYPNYFYPLIWSTFFFLLDPINYLHKQPSIIQHLKDRKLAIPFSLLLAGIILGFFWEFWNYWATTKWYYNIPFVGFFKIFEMPILGYLGYFPFSFELYAMYWFTRSLLLKKEKQLI